MAVVITYADVINGFDTAVPQAQVEMLIAIVDEADTCLDANSVSDSRQEMLKIMAVRHMSVMMSASASGKGAVTSEQAPSGAGRSYKPPSGMGLESSTYGALLKQLDSYGCVTTLLENTAHLSIRSVGRRACE